MRRKTKIAILGFGREGKSVLKFLKKSPAYRGAKIEILDRKFGKNYLKNLKRFDIIFRSPGIPWNLPELRRARRAGVKFSSATKLFFEKSPTKNIIGITGTKGKGTTATLLYEIFKAARKSVFLGGNIGKSPLELLSRLNKNSLVVLELSSFQLQDLEKSPPVAVILDIFPDHQDAHLSLKEYYEAKANIVRYQRRSDKIFYFKDSALSRWVTLKSRGRKFPVNEKMFKLFKPEELKIKGYHNFKNAAMAATVAQKLGIPRSIILKTVKNFRGTEHRLEFVGRIGKVEFWNDSASTNPQTAAAAVRSFSDSKLKAKSYNLILIAGGYDKGLNYKPLAQALKNSGTKLAVLFGQNKKKIQRQLVISNQKLEIRSCANLKSAVETAYRFAKKILITNYQLPVTILFSPGAASFDMFLNYADRGRQFKKIVKRL